MRDFACRFSPPPHLSAHHGPQALPGGVVQKGEYVVENPTRDDKNKGSFSINLTTGKWLDFAGDSKRDSGTDLISLYAYIHGGLEQGEAIKDLKKGEFREIKVKKIPKTSKKHDLAQMFNIPNDMWSSAPNSFSKKENGKWVKYPFVKKWPYHTKDGLVFGYIGRIESEKF